METMTGDVEGPSLQGRYTCAFCGAFVEPLDAIGMVVHALKECRERMREERDAERKERVIALNAIKEAHKDLLSLVEYDGKVAARETLGAALDILKLPELGAAH